MSVNIHSIHFHIDNDLEEFIEKKVNKLLKLDNKIISSDFFSKRQSDTFEESTTQVFQALRKQILRNNTKR